jgi:hypothetical protein
MTKPLIEWGKFVPVPDLYGGDRALPVTNHDHWLVHHHLGRSKTPLTVYKMAGGKYELWWGKRQIKDLSFDEMTLYYGRILFRAMRQGQAVTL